MPLTPMADRDSRQRVERKDPITNTAWLIAAGYVGVYLSIALNSAWQVPFPNNFDELAHLSYIAHVARFGLSDPGEGSMFLLPTDLSPVFTPTPNYLNHPPAYYVALSQLLPHDGWPTIQTVHVLRSVNVGLSTLAVACALVVAVLRKIERRSLLLYGAMIVCAPTLRHIGGAINNDNLALLGGCACVLGAQIRQACADRGFGKTLLILGCAVAALAKLTAALLTGVFVLAFVLMRWRAERRRPDGLFIVLLAAVELVVCVPYAWYLVAHGSPAPSSPAFLEVYRQAAQDGDGLRGWVLGQTLSPLEYAGQFAVWLFANWNPVITMTGWANAAVLTTPALVLLLAAPAFVVNAPTRRTADFVISAGGTALAVILPLHLLFSYRLYQATLSPPMDAVPRYYFPIALAVVPAAACWTLSRMPPAMRIVLIWLVLIGLFAALPIISLCDADRCP